jgi:D-alanyl-D-alanine carboxypeptidase
MTRALAALAVAVAAVSIVAVGVSRDRDAPELGPLVDEVVASGAPGVLVAVRDGRRTWTLARGFADRDGAKAMRADARFRAGSVTKTFVATLVLQLAGEGRLGLDDPVDRWLPGLLPRGREITVRELLSHTSGLADYVDEPPVARDPDRRWRPRELISLAASRPPAQPPSARGFAYSSANYLVLGLIAEKAGGAPLGRQLRERLFEPLRLKRTSFVPGRLRGSHVHGYRAPSHQGVVTGRPVDVGARPVWWAWAAGGIVSDAPDLQRFFASLLGGRLLRPQLLSAMRTLVPAGRQRYGLGLAVFPTPCGPAWGHTGNLDGTIVVAWNSRDGRRQLVLVVNTYPLSPELEAAVRHLQDEAFCRDA